MTTSRRSAAPRGRRRARRAALALLLAGALAAPVGCRGYADDDTRAHAAILTGGDPTRGKRAIARYGCGSCHTIPGIRGASSLVGPPLTGIAQRVYIAGVVANTPDQMIRWIMSPRSVDPRTAMPDMGIPEHDARDIAGYLYTLR